MAGSGKRSGANDDSSGTCCPASGSTQFAARHMLRSSLVVSWYRRHWALLQQCRRVPQATSGQSKFCVIIIVVAKIIVIVVVATITIYSTASGKHSITFAHHRRVPVHRRRRLIVIVVTAGDLGGVATRQ